MDHELYIRLENIESKIDYILSVIESLIGEQEEDLQEETPKELINLNKKEEIKNQIYKQ